ncbi:unnamed protein product [Heterobilharzia americana]|nr:unnamed protein product [Heterobilharzia americana]
MPHLLSESTNSLTNWLTLNNRESLSATDCTRLPIPSNTIGNNMVITDTTNNSLSSCDRDIVINQRISSPIRNQFDCSDHFDDISLSNSTTTSTTTATTCTITTTTGNSNNNKDSIIPSYLLNYTSSHVFKPEDERLHSQENENEGGKEVYTHEKCPTETYYSPITDCFTNTSLSIMNNSIIIDSSISSNGSSSNINRKSKSCDILQVN